MPIIDFYGALDRAMFPLERKAMDLQFWERMGFELEEIETSFEFETLERRTGSSASTSAIAVVTPGSSGSPSKSGCT